MTMSVNIHEAKTHLSRLLEQVAAGERVVISKAGTPVADLVPHRAETVTFGGLKGEIAYSDDAFGIDPDIQEMFYGDAPSCESGHAVAAGRHPAARAAGTAGHNVRARRARLGGDGLGADPQDQAREGYRG